MKVIEAHRCKENPVDVEEARPHHLTLLDIFTPGIDVFRFLESMKKSQVLKNVPVIVLSSDKKVETREKGFQPGADDLIIKPMSIEEVMPGLRRFLW